MNAVQLSVMITWAGIVTGPMIGRCGGAVTMAAGGVLCCAGCIGSSLAPSIYVLVVCFGGVTGPLTPSVPLTNTYKLVTVYCIRSLGTRGSFSVVYIIVDIHLLFSCY